MSDHTIPACELLIAVLDERERIARAATKAPWTADGFDVYDSSKLGEVVAEAGLSPADARHIAAWDPDAVLRHIGVARETIRYAQELHTLGGTPASIATAILKAEALRWGVMS